jgi:2,4-dienoyl-CoA reductase-like NADH-dependent reductase (Old Yellow Enzyme family)/thioredoxin reductase
MNYPHLLEPIPLGSLILKNRLAMSQMTMNYATEEGFVTERLIRHYLERARGGVGLILVEGTFFTREGRGYKNQVGLSSPEHMKGLRKLTDAVHGVANPPKIFLQIHHAGWRASSKLTGFPTVAPSALPPYPGGEVARALSHGKIKNLVEAHILTAARAKEAGFDGVDFHCAHGYLIPSFFSPLSNQRTDEYGGDLAGRTRFLLEIVRGTKERLGRDFPVTINISGDEYIEGGLHIKEMSQIAHLAQEAGIDGILVSAGTVGGKKVEDLSQAHKVLRTLPMMTNPGCLVPLAEEMKKALRIPVITVGRINHPALAEDIVAQGKADLVAMGRALLADPHLPRKALEGKENEIRPCIACNEGCYKRIFQQLDIRCSVNPTLGREEEIFCPKATSPKRVAVIGGGPGGMEAAHAAWERGHKVLLLEASQQLGGQLNLASLSPGRKEIERFQTFLQTRLQRTNVMLVKGQSGMASALKEYAPEAVILALGAHPRKIKIKGLEENRMASAWEVLGGKADIQEPVLVLGAGLVGCETADHLREKGRKVILVEVLGEIGTGADADTKAYFTLKFKKNGVEVLTGAELKRVEGESAILLRGEEELRVPLGTLVYAVGAEANNHLSDELTSSGFKVIKVGDCLQPRSIMEAIQEGFQAGRSVCSGPASLFPSAEDNNQFKMGTGGNKTWSQKVA